nr:helix-turn-helix domain-containing protein [uncultured Dysosmobacter sp.]
MERTEFVALLDRQVKLVRTEYGLNQEVMARVLGISKKTLVEIEKGRTSLGWTGAVALCAIFSGSQVLSGVLGGEAGELIRALAFQDLRPTYPRTLGGKVWWRFVETLGPYTIQQNLISQHYRALDREDGRVFSSFDLEEVRQRLEELEGMT